MNILKQAVEWFLIAKAPHLKERAENTLKIIDEKKALDPNQKQLLGFVLFDYSMHKGPSSFDDCERTAIDTGVIDELHFYAKDCINYLTKAKTEKVQA